MKYSNKITKECDPQKYKQHRTKNGKVSGIKNYKTTLGKFLKENPNHLSQIGKLGLETTNRLRKEHRGLFPREWLLWCHSGFRKFKPVPQDSRFFSDKFPIKFRMDFSLPEYKIAIEIDGPEHKEKLEEDSKRDNFLKEMGWLTLRFTNEEVETNIDYVVEKINSTIKEMGISRRPSLFDIMMGMAELVSKRSTCVRLQVGCVITNENLTSIEAFGYNGGARGLSNECESLEPGKCGHIHAEVNALVKCNYGTKHKKMFITHSPCSQCAKLIVNAGIEEVYCNYLYRDFEKPLEILNFAKIKMFVYRGQENEGYFIDLMKLMGGQSSDSILEERIL
jgi:dCMP deaminase